MKKEKLFLSLLTATLALPSTLFVAPSLTFAEEMEETSSTINVDATSQGSLTIQIGSQIFNNVTTRNFSLGSFPYEGKEIAPAVQVTWIPKDGKKISLEQDQDFSITWKNNKNAGKATGKLKFLDPYQGATRNIEFQITPINLNKGTTITLESDSYTLTSDLNEIKPTIQSVKVGSLSLTERTDYTVEYSNNNQVGTGTVMITGKGNFEGTASKQFSIRGIALENITMALPALKEIHTTSGSLDANEKVILQNYLNKDTELNSYHYDYIVDNASIQTTGDTATFTMTVSAKLKDESVVDLTFMNLKSRTKTETAMENEEEMEETAAYEIVDESNGKKVTIKGILAQDAFRVNGKLNSTTIRNILKEDYKVDNLDFSSSQGKDSKFVIRNLKDPICIEVATTKKVTSTSMTPVSGDGTIDLPSPPATEPTIPMVVKKPTYRFFNTHTGEHFYTSSEEERDELMKDSRWNNEGQAWIAPDSSDYVIYRVCNPNTGEHHFTMDKNEYDTLQTRGWRKEGIGFYSAKPSETNIVPLYRLYNSKAKDAGSHHYTASEMERDNLVKDGWNYEGVAWYGLK